MTRPTWRVHVCFWLKADITWARRRVRFQGESGHGADWLALPRLTRSGSRFRPLTSVRSLSQETVRRGGERDRCGDLQPGGSNPATTRIARRVSRMCWIVHRISTSSIDKRRHGDFAYHVGKFLRGPRSLRAGRPLLGAKRTSIEGAPMSGNPKRTWWKRPLGSPRRTPRELFLDTLELLPVRHRRIVVRTRRVFRRRLTRQRGNVARAVGEDDSRRYPHQ
jgi:hypothetical protein